MENEQTTTEETLAGDMDVQSSDGESAGNSSISLQEINTILGKDFKDVDTALKSVKDTFSFVGKAGSYNNNMKKLTTELGMSEDRILTSLKSMSENPTPQEQAPQVDPSKFISREQYETDMFYKDNADYVPLRPVIDAMAVKEGKSVREVVESDVIKDLVQKTTGYNQIQNQKSVLESNPRLNMASDKLSKAHDSYKESIKSAQAGDAMTATAQFNDSKRSVVSAVREAFDIN